MKSRGFYVLSSTILLLALTACGEKISISQPVITSTSISSSVNSSEEELPKPDYSNLPYVSSLKDNLITNLKASWIWDSKCVNDSYVAFRKKFNLAEIPNQAIAYISAESKYFLWINETLVVLDGSSKRGPTPYDSYVETVDLAPYLQKGDNLIAFLVVYNGRDGNSSISPDQGGLLFEMKVGEEYIVSDSTFKVSRRKEYRNKTLLKGDYPNYNQSSMLAENNVYYDAREADGDFTKFSYDDTSWANASVVAKAYEPPFNNLYLCETDLMTFSNEYIDFEDADKYINQEFNEKTLIELSFPENLQFSLYFELESVEGKHITYYTDTYMSQGMGSFKDEYVTSDGYQKYESYPWRSGNKLIMEVDEGIIFHKIAYRVSSYPSVRSGTFISDDEKLNTLWKKAQNTLLICMRDTYMDCPDRERSPYLGDAANQISMSFYALDRNADKLTKKTIRTLLGWIEDDYIFPSRSPSKTTSEIPAQNLAFILSTKDYYLNTGDAETMKLFYPAIKNYLGVWKMSNGLPEYRAGEFPWTDWGNNADEKLIQVLWYYLALEVGEYFAEEFSYNEDLSFYQERLNSIKNNFESSFRKEMGYMSSTMVTPDERANALAIIAGLTNPEDDELVTNILFNVRQASPYMEKYVLEALCQLKQFDLAKTRMLERYEEMINDSGSTLFELWKKEDGSVNHGWTGGALTVMSQYFVGIKPLTKGYDSYEIDLQDFTDSLEYNVSTVKGDISIKLTKDSDQTIIDLKTITSEGHLKLPTSLGESLIITGDQYEDLRSSEGYILLKGNHYQITIK